MIYRDNRNACLIRGIVAYALLILPAVTLGVLAMIHGSVSPVLWGQQLAAWMVFAFLTWPLQRMFRMIPADIWAFLFLIPLAAALFGKEAGGARRWIDLGVFNVNAALLVLPALLVMLSSMRFPYPVLLGAALILCEQPSLAQLIAFSAAALPILWKKKKKLWGMGSVLLLCVLVIRAMRMPVTIEPVPYCEGILAMLCDMSWMLQAAGWVSLAAIPAFWLIRFCRGAEAQAISIFVYYTVSLLFVLTGEYPVPIMGFGISPIAGYYLAYACSLMTDEKKASD